MQNMSAQALAHLAEVRGKTAFVPRDGDKGDPNAQKSPSDD
jgi:hypothetical protein